MLVWRCGGGGGGGGRRRPRPAGTSWPEPHRSSFRGKPIIALCAVVRSDGAEEVGWEARRADGAEVDVDKVLAPVKKLRRGMGTSASAKKTLEDIGMEGVTKEVVAMEARGVMGEIERIACEIALSIVRGDGYSFTMPARTSSNMVYVAELDRLVLRDKMLERVFANASSARKTAITTRVLQLVMELCSRASTSRSATSSTPTSSSSSSRPSPTTSSMTQPA